MKPQTADFLEAAQEALAQSKQIDALPIPAQAARLAYYAQFHAAQAFIFEREGKIAKTHKGVQTQFHKLAQNDAAIGKQLAVSLSANYFYKETADYHTGAGSKITPQHSARAIQDAEHFLAAVTAALSPSPAKQPGTLA